MDCNLEGKRCAYNQVEIEDCFQNTSTKTLYRETQHLFGDIINGCETAGSVQEIPDCIVQDDEEGRYELGPYDGGTVNQMVEIGGGSLRFNGKKNGVILIREILMGKND